MRSRLGVLLAVGAAMMVGALLPPAAEARPEPRATPSPRWVAVSVATLWVRPGETRAVDAPALANPADPRAWVTQMTVAQKRWLVGRLETQVLYGTKVYLLATSGAWSRVVVPGQPTPRDARGYPGWAPSRQLAKSPPVAAARIAVVRRPTAWLRETAALSGRVLELSYGTRLPAVRWTSTWVEVVMLDGRHLYLKRSVVALHTPGTPWAALTGTVALAEARRFLGLQFLYGGTSGFGFDCSGLTHSVFRALGKTIPRDADAQSAHGLRIASRAALRPGDLVFFRNAAGYVHHVGMYAGNGTMIHSPRTGEPVRVVSIYREPYLSEFAGGRRYAAVSAPVTGTRSPASLPH